MIWSYSNGRWNLSTVQVVINNSVSSPAILDKISESREIQLSLFCRKDISRKMCESTQYADGIPRQRFSHSVNKEA